MFIYLRSLFKVETSNSPQEKVLTLKKKMSLNRKWTDKVADFLTAIFGSVSFLTLNALWFGLWILVNVGLIPGLEPFDPFPFGLLTMIVSLEAIFLAIIVLISQNRAARIAELREEVDLQINVKAENEITRMLNMIDQIHNHLGLAPEEDEEFLSMKKSTNLDELEEELTKEI